MKVTFALASLVAMAASTVSAAPANPNISVDGKRDPVKDLHGFQLVVSGKYDRAIAYRATTGKKSNNYKETRTSDDKLWKVEHTDDVFTTKVTLTVKGKKHVLNRHNKFTMGMTGWKSEYWTCVDW
ncbi:hypothetical protein BGW39_008003 [Mortierella sp. 14UC]|nr:hypothetical protein BGW39_008003 [Mortierella sp. 14UC]